MNMLIKIATIILVANTLAIGMAAAEPANKPTEKDKDGYTIFYLSLQNAGNTQTKTISVSGQEGNRTLVFTNHVLSCGTWMNGDLLETTRDGRIYIKGNWKVTNNPFDISTLAVDLGRPVNAFGWEGEIVVDGRICQVANSKITKVKESGKS